MIMRQKLDLMCLMGLTLLAASDAGVQPWTDDDLESMQKGIVMTFVTAFKAARELGQRQVQVWLILLHHTARKLTCMQCMLPCAVRWCADQQ